MTTLDDRRAAAKEVLAKLAALGALTSAPMAASAPRPRPHPRPSRLHGFRTTF